jgi:DNA repair protein SbcC/Rad50
MIPLQLSLSGFLSYREPVELDFTSFELACISGSNGAGKSSLLDAITWVLFGQARKRDDSVINAQSSAAEVCLTFAYEGNIYRVQRTKPRDKTAILEFHILQNSHPQSSISNHKFSISNLQSLIPTHAVWKPLTERSLRETESRIQQTLRMDFDTFVNASFFLQGKADQFTQQRPGDRKRILSSILGLEVWEGYRLRTAERRKVVESDIAGIDGRLQEIAAELAEEETRKDRLELLESDLKRLSQSRLVQEAALENIRKVAATLAEQHKLVQTLARQWEASTRRLSELELRMVSRQAEREAFAQTLGRAVLIEEIYAAWQAARLDLERWEEVATQFRQHEKRRQEPLDEINAVRARLMQELQALLAQKDQIETFQTEISNLQNQITLVNQAKAQAEGRLEQRIQLDADLQAARQRQAEARAENPRLRAEMDELKERIDQLAQVEGALCPLCGQPLSEQERQNLIDSLTVQGKDMGARFRANQLLLNASDGQVRELETQIGSLAQVEAELRAHDQSAAQLSSRLELLETQCTAWQSTGAPRLYEIALSLEREVFAPDAHARLAEVDAELKAIGYDAAAHDQARRAELSGRASEDELRSLEKARAALAPLEREITELDSQISNLQTETTRQQEEHDNAAAALAAAEAQAPDLYAAERDLLALQEQENRLRMEVGAARQKVLVLDDLKARRRNLDTQREELASLVGQYKQLERAFGKDGVPALLIEQALPQIESKANEMLDRLSGGSMTVRFITQAAYKEKRRDDLKETLDIQISDGAGTRDYEMYSGGEAFRVNFAIRLALSEVLAQRAGARLQTLVIDEGFGSQDAQGRQRLIEAINLVRPDFAKILVITHIEELKDAFPNRIEVEKTDRGSVVTIT